MNKMNQNIKGQWVELLRSGNYIPTKGTLRRDDCFCAYGVLCDLYIKNQNNVEDIEINFYIEENVDKIEWQLETESGRYRFLNMWDLVPDKIFDWAECGVNDIGIPYAKKLDKISEMNDKENKTFKEIADYIEKEL